MATIAALLKINYGTTSARTAISTPLAGELFYDTTLAALYLYNGSAWVAANGAGTTEVNAYQSGTDGAGAAISSAATTTITLAALNLKKTAEITVSGGSGTYTHVIVLDTTNANAGDECDIILDMAASTNPTIEVRNATSGGTLLDTIHDTSGTETMEWFGHYVFNGSAWRKKPSFYQVI